MHRTLQSTPYIDTIDRFGKRVRELEGWFTCVHVRVSDSYFQATKRATLQSILKQLQPLATSGGKAGTPPSLLVISDVPLLELPTEFTGALRRDFGVFAVEEKYRELMVQINTELGFALDLMHFEASACIHAGKFIGNPVSTFSRRITDLRDRLNGW